MTKKHEVRVTQPILAVVRCLMANPTEGLSGAEMAKETLLGSGTLYPVLARLETAGWLKSRWEKVEPSEVGRPRRRYYELTGVGRRQASAALTPLQIGGGRMAWT
jgi:PadR family transcriptional regulator, regulatory protein PadR